VDRVHIIDCSENVVCVSTGDAKPFRFAAEEVTKEEAGGYTRYSVEESFMHTDGMPF